VVSYVHSRIRKKDTKPEVALRRALWAAGLRFRKHYEGASGTPDIAFTKVKVAVFCDGLFWHGHNWEERKLRLVSNRECWIPKIERNMSRDERVNRELQEAGWTVLRFWESDIKRDLAGCVELVRQAVLDVEQGEREKNR
jgi:DNA mismatch endonuclease (patch repair protein)